MDTESPLTSIDSDISSGRKIRGGSETSQQSEGSSPKTKQHNIDSDDEDIEEVQHTRRASSSSAHKRKRKSRIILSDEDEDESRASEDDNRQRSTISSKSNSQERQARRNAGIKTERSTSKRATSQRRRKLSSHFSHSDDDGLSFTAPLASPRQRSTSSNSVSQEREVKRLQIVGRWAESGSSNTSWATRPKRHVANRVVSYGTSTPAMDALLEPALLSAPAQPPRPKRPYKRKAVKEDDDVVRLLDTQNSKSAEINDSLGTAPPPKIKKVIIRKPAKSGRDIISLLDVDSDEPAEQDESSKILSKPRRQAAKRIVSYVPLFDVDGNAIGDSDAGPSISTPQPRKVRKRPQTKVSQMQMAVDASDPSSYDSLFDGDAFRFSEDDEAIAEVTTSGRRLKASPAKAHKEAVKSRQIPNTVSYADISHAGVSIFEEGGKQYLPQYSVCQRNFMLRFQQCRHCVSKQAGDSCRFVGIRAVPVIEENGRIELLSDYVAEPERIGRPIFINDATLNEKIALPDHFDLNRPMDDDSKIKIMTTCAKSLIGILKEGLERASQPNCIRRAREVQIRAMCDFCSTGLFSASYMCTRCGGEYCLPCKDALDTMYGEDLQLFTCVKDKWKPKKTDKTGKRYPHTASMMIPVSRFSIDELQEEVAAMEQIIKDNESSVPTSKLEPETDTVDSQDIHLSEVIPSHPLTLESKTTMDRERFLSTWAKGRPLVVTDVCTQSVWDPKAFVKKYGDMGCDIVRCDEHAPFMFKEKVIATLKANPNYFRKWEKPVKVHEFFETFGKPDEERAAIFGKGIWKLKDWPPAAEFSTAFPDIYEDFNYAVPMPDFTRRDGCINISSLFPKNANGPDLGPKMYNAWPGEHTKGKKGTTCLHMDIADAVNILLYTAEREGAEQAAQWDIFRAEDANAIRDFLREKYPKTIAKGDPIHAQVHYLDDDLLQELYKEKGVYSWRILQRSGQAVFIPAGCAHQVCNLTDCIKVAVDFISPQNVARCFQLTEEFRGLTLEGRKSWKEDVLQLKAQLWYAWKACRALPPAPTIDEHKHSVMKRQLEKEKEQQEAIAKRDRRRSAVNNNVKGLKEVYTVRPTRSRKKIEEQDAVIDTDESQTSRNQSIEAAEAQLIGNGVSGVKAKGTFKVKEEESEMDAAEAGDTPDAEEAIIRELKARAALTEEDIAEKEIVENSAVEELMPEVYVAEQALAQDTVTSPAIAEETIKEDTFAEKHTTESCSAEDTSTEDTIVKTEVVTEVIEETLAASNEAVAPIEGGLGPFESIKGTSERTEQSYEPAEEIPEMKEGVLRAIDVPVMRAEILALNVDEEDWDCSTPPRPSDLSHPPHSPSPCTPPRTSLHSPSISNLLN